jgi:transposase-like protein
MGFKAFHSAQATIAGIETAHMIRKGQLSEENIPAYKQFDDEFRRFIAGLGVKVNIST